MATLKQILAEIEDLKKQADEIRSAERAAVITEMRKGIDLYQISLEELGIDPMHKPKYKKGWKIWSGVGHPPPWIRDYVAAGGKLEDLLLNK